MRRKKQHCCYHCTVTENKKRQWILNTRNLTLISWSIQCATQVFPFPRENSRITLEVWQLSTGQNLYRAAYPYQLPQKREWLMGHASERHSEQMKESRIACLVNYSDFILFAQLFLHLFSFPAYTGFPVFSSCLKKNYILCWIWFLQAKKMDKHLDVRVFNTSNPSNPFGLLQSCIAHLLTYQPVS